jgi:fucose permease
VVGIEAIYPTSALLVALVGGASIPEMCVAVNDENLFSIGGTIHSVLCLLFVMSALSFKIEEEQRALTTMSNNLSLH